MSKVSVIVPVYNALKDVTLCLKSLKRNFDFSLGEIIIINDYSDNATTDFLQNFSNKNKNFKLVENENNLGFVKTCNKGMLMANGEIIVLLNSDTVIPKYFLEKIIACFDSDEKIGVASPIASFSNQYYIPCQKHSDIKKSIIYWIKSILQPIL